MVVHIPLSKTGKYAGKYEAIVDDIDGDLAELNWSVSFTQYGVYAVRSVINGETYKNVKLHTVVSKRFVSFSDNNLMIDHINGDGLDNRRENLRVATRSQNAANSLRKNRLYGKGLKGAYWNKRLKVWSSSIRVKGKTIHLGYFQNEEDAHNAYCESAKIHFGEFSRFY